MSYKKPPDVSKRCEELLNTPLCDVFDQYPKFKIIYEKESDRIKTSIILKLWNSTLQTNDIDDDLLELLTLIQKGIDEGVFEKSSLTPAALRRCQILASKSIPELSNTTPGFKVLFDKTPESVRKELQQNWGKTPTNNTVLQFIEDGVASGAIGEEKPVTVSSRCESILSRPLFEVLKENSQFNTMYEDTTDSFKQMVIIPKWGETPHDVELVMFVESGIQKGYFDTEGTALSPRCRSILSRPLHEVLSKFPIFRNIYQNAPASIREEYKACWGTENSKLIKIIENNLQQGAFEISPPNNIMSESCKSLLKIPFGTVLERYPLFKNLFSAAPVEVQQEYSHAWGPDSTSSLIRVVEAAIVDGTFDKQNPPIEVNADLGNLLSQPFDDVLKKYPQFKQLYETSPPNVRQTYCQNWGLYCKQLVDTIKAHFLDGIFGGIQMSQRCRGLLSRPIDEILSSYPTFNAAFTNASPVVQQEFRTNWGSSSRSLVQQIENSINSGVFENQFHPTERTMKALPYREAMLSYPLIRNMYEPEYKNMVSTLATKTGDKNIFLSVVPSATGLQNMAPSLPLPPVPEGMPGPPPLPTRLANLFDLVGVRFPLVGDTLIPQRSLPIKMPPGPGHVPVGMSIKGPPPPIGGSWGPSNGRWQEVPQSNPPQYYPPPVATPSPALLGGYQNPLVRPPLGGIQVKVPVPAPVVTPSTSYSVLPGAQPVAYPLSASQFPTPFQATPSPYYSAMFAQQQQQYVTQQQQQAATTRLAAEKEKEQKEVEKKQELRAQKRASEAAARKEVAAKKKSVAKQQEKKPQTTTESKITPSKEMIDDAAKRAIKAARDAAKEAGLSDDDKLITTYYYPHYYKYYIDALIKREQSRKTKSAPSTSTQVVTTDGIGNFGLAPKKATAKQTELQTRLRNLIKEKDDDSGKWITVDEAPEKKKSDSEPAKPAKEDPSIKLPQKEIEVIEIDQKQSPTKDTTPPEVVTQEPKAITVLDKPIKTDATITETVKPDDSTGVETTKPTSDNNDDVEKTKTKKKVKKSSDKTPKKTKEKKKSSKKETASKPKKKASSYTDSDSENERRAKKKRKKEKKKSKKEKKSRKKDKRRSYSSDYVSKRRKDYTLSYSSDEEYYRTRSRSDYDGRQPPHFEKQSDQHNEDYNRPNTNRESVIQHYVLPGSNFVRRGRGRGGRGRAW